MQHLKKIVSFILLFTLLFSNFTFTNIASAAPVTNTVSYTDFTQSTSPNEFLTATSVASVQSMPGITNSTPKEYSKINYTTTTCSGNEVVVDIESTGMRWTTRSYLIDNATDPNHGDILMIKKRAKHLSQLHYTFSSPIKLEELKIEGIDNGEGVYLSADKALTIVGNNVNISATPSKLSTVTQNGASAGDITISSNDAITKLTVSFGVVSGGGNPNPKRQIIVKGGMKFACDTAVYTCKKPTFASSSSVGTTDLNTISANNTNPAGASTLAWYDSPTSNTALTNISSATAKTYYASFATNTDSRCRTAFNVKSDFDKDGVSIDTDQDNDNDGILNSAEKYCDSTTPPNGSSGLPVGSGDYKSQLLFFNLDGITIDDNTTFPVTIPSVTHNGTTYTATINQANLSQANTFDSGVVKRVAFVGTDIGADHYSPDSNISSYYDIGGAGFKEAFYINKFVGRATMSVTIKAESGGIEYPVEAVVFDAETTTKRSDTEFEKVTINTTGSPFKELELFHSGGVTPVYGTGTISGKDTQTLTIHNADTNTNANSFNGLGTTEGLSPTLNYTLDRMGGISTNGVGFAVRIYCDYEKDGKPNFIDTDSDNDGCFGAVEGAGSITDSQVDGDGFITGGVDANGIPTAIGASGQAIGKSREAGRINISSQPSNQSANAGTDVNLSVTATADQTSTFTSTGAPNYTSLGNDTVTYKRWEVSTNSGSTWTTIENSSGSTLSLTGVTADMNGSQYRAVMSCSANTCDNFSSGATLTINSYTLSYDANTGTGTMADETKVSGSTSNLTANTFTKAGYTFAGWNTQANGSGSGYTNTGSFTMPNTNTTLYAQWTPNTDTPYEVEHYLQNSDGTTYPTTANPIETLSGTTDTIVNAGSRAFTGYTYTDSHTGNTQTGSIAPDGSLVLKRYYSINTYTLAFESNGGTAVLTQTGIIYNTTATQPINPTKSGYTFGGWFTDNTTFANQFDFTNPITEDTTVYAKWILKSSGGSGGSPTIGIVKDNPNVTTGDPTPPKDPKKTDTPEDPKQEEPKKPDTPKKPELPKNIKEKVKKILEITDDELEDIISDDNLDSRREKVRGYLIRKKEKTIAQEEKIKKEDEEIGLGEIEKYPKLLPQTGVGVNIYKRVKRLNTNPNVYKDLPKNRLRLAGSKQIDLDYWLQVLDKRDRKKDKYIVLPIQGLVIPINALNKATDKNYTRFLKGKKVSFQKYLETGAVEVPGTSIRGYGEIGNKVIAGHSSYWKYKPGRYKTDFQQIIATDAGEEVWVYEKQTTGKYKRYVYKIEASYNTKANDISVLKPRIGKNLTLITCTPIGGIAGRWIVKAKFIGN